MLEKGRIVESGSHAELVALKGLYYARCRIESLAPGFDPGNERRRDSAVPARPPYGEAGGEQ